MPSGDAASVAFNYVDRNQDGVVDRDEFQQLFKQGSPLMGSSSSNTGGVNHSAAHITKKLLEDVRAENDELLTQKNNAVQKLQQKDQELRAMAALLQTERKNVDLLKKEIAGMAVEQRRSQSPQRHSAGLDGALPQELAMRQEIASLREDLATRDRLLGVERIEVEQIEEDLNEANLELTNVYRELKSSKRQVAALSAQQILANEGEANAVALLEQGHGGAKANHASCWVRQCLLQWCGNAAAARHQEVIHRLMHEAGHMARSGAKVLSHPPAIGASPWGSGEPHMSRALLQLVCVIFPKSQP